MERDDRRRFVHEHRTAVLGYNRRSEGPAMTLVHYVTDGDDLLVSTTAARAKTLAVKRNSKVSRCILDEQWPPAYLQVYGEAVVDEDLEHAVDLMCQIIDRTTDAGMSPERLPGVRQMCEEQRRVVIRVTPQSTFTTPPRGGRQPESGEVPTIVTTSLPW